MEKQDDKQVTRVVAIIIMVACVVLMGVILCKGGPKTILDATGIILGGFSLILLGAFFVSWIL